MSFRNPVAGGLQLIRSALQSAGFISGSVGWSIDRDGDAEFNNAVIRGDFESGPAGSPIVTISSNGLFVFDANGDLIASINATTADVSIFDGAGSGYATFDASSQTFRIAEIVNRQNNDPINFSDVAGGTSDPIDLTNGGRPIYYSKADLPDLVTGTASVGPTNGTNNLTVATSNSIDLDGNTRVEVILQFARVDTTVANDVFTFSVRDNGTVRRTFRHLAPAAADDGRTIRWVSDSAPSAGSHTFDVIVARASGTGTLTVNGSATNLIQLTVQEFL